MSGLELKEATFTCRIQSKTYPEYSGSFQPWSLSADRQRKSIGISINKDGRLLFRSEWWMPAKYRPTWSELYQKLDQIIGRVLENENNDQSSFQ